MIQPWWFHADHSEQQLFWQAFVSIFHNNLVLASPLLIIRTWVPVPLNICVVLSCIVSAHSHNTDCLADFLWNPKWKYHDYRTWVSTQHKWFCSSIYIFDIDNFGSCFVGIYTLSSIAGEFLTYLGASCPELCLWVSNSTAAHIFLHNCTHWFTRLTCLNFHHVGINRTWVSVLVLDVKVNTSHSLTDCNFSAGFLSYCVNSA